MPLFIHRGMAGTIIKSENPEDKKGFFDVHLGNSWYLRIAQEAQLLRDSTCVLSSAPSAEVCEKIIR